MDYTSTQTNSTSRLSPASNMVSTTKTCNSTVSSTTSTTSRTPVLAYCDGSSVSYNGGYGIVVLSDDNLIKIHGQVPFERCTNNQAELYAILETLNQTSAAQELIIRTDSQYSIGCLTTWIKNWKRNGWKTSAGKPVENKELIQQIDSILQKRNVRFVHVRGHNGDVYNEMADKLANQGRLNL